MTDLAPPADLVAEAAVLSAILLRPESLDDVGALTSADLYDVRHRAYLDAIREVDASGERVDAVTVRARLVAAGSFERLGGHPFLTDLLDATPAVGHVRDHAQIVTGLARVRRASGKVEAGGLRRRKLRPHDAPFLTTACTVANEPDVEFVATP